MKLVSRVSFLTSIILSLTAPSFAYLCEIPLTESSGAATKDNGVSINSQRTDGYAAYLGYLLETRVISDFQAETILRELETNSRLINPISEEDAQLDYDQFIHRQGLQKFIDADGIDRELLKRWLRKTLEGRGVARIEREETRVETEDVHQKMIFHRIEPGEFDMGYFGATVHVIITKPFDMMSTQVTQMMWSQVMRDNPSRFSNGINTITMKIDGASIQMQPDNPVEKVNAVEDVIHPSYQVSVFNFINKLNQMSKDDHPLMHKLIPDYMKGDVYRLPTAAEWEFVVRARGIAIGNYHFGDDDSLLGDYAWYWGNSGAMTHPVAEKKPLVIDGKEFFDLHGNVWEWVSDWFGNVARDKTLVDPQGPETSWCRMNRGGCAFSNTKALRSAFRSTSAPNGGSSVGFRLARTRISP